MLRSPVSLIFHDVVPYDGASDDSGFLGPGPAHYKFSFDSFRKCLDVLNDPPRAPAVTGPGGALPPPDAWMLHFDDGGSSSLWIADELEHRGWRGLFHIVSGRVDTPGFAPAADIRELAARGHVVGSHSATHPDRMSVLSSADLLTEWKTSRSYLEDLLGGPVPVASVPGGYYSAAVLRAAGTAGYRTLFTSEPVRSLRDDTGCTAVGRYSVVRTSDPATLARLVAGDRTAEFRQRAAWDTKKLAKRIGGPWYLAARRAVLSRRR